MNILSFLKTALSLKVSEKATQIGRNIPVDIVNVKVTGKIRSNFYELYKIK